jgi:hypothetical protein
MTRRRGPAGIVLSIGRFRAVLLAAALVAGCESFGGGAVPSGAATIGMVNATSGPVAIYVNGVWVGTYPAWSEERAIPVFGRGGPPWNVQFRTPGDLVVGGLEIGGIDDGGSSSDWQSTCGRFVTWSGEQPADVPALDPAAPRPPDPPCR